MKLSTKPRKGLLIEASGPRPKVKQLQPYYYQGGKWFKLKLPKGGK